MHDRLSTVKSQVQAELDRVHIGDLRKGVDDRDEHNDAHLEEHGDGHQEANGGERHRDALGAKLLGVVRGQRLHTAGHLDHPAKDGAECDEQCEAHGEIIAEPGSGVPCAMRPRPGAASS